ncbi:hypothetical protein [Mammaliicoccus sp. Dog046]|uniref:hypothetical protein n=1 Tax=Mammaliicoccus sp. Dog046 TaxID=3034233 RepID=UPI002B2641D5|nr:hypothetical protein [Mammaliicoccus sp. Dog046]WQK84646.1 hypothetical protein P3U32_08370 [Mammaliicoccus sp. Dog046]
MSNFIDRSEFNQFEQRVDDKFNAIEKKIDNIPSSSDIKLMLMENNKELKKEAKHDRNTIIGWTIAIVGLAVTITRTLGWL